MIKISLKKIVTKKEVLAAIENIAIASEDSVTIEDIQGKILLGEPHKNPKKKYPVELADETIGWVIGSEIASAIASLLSYIVNQELEKKTIAAELLDKYRETTLLYNISQKMTASLDLKEVAALVIDEVKRLIAATGGAVLLLNEITGNLEVIAKFGDLDYGKLPLDIGQGIVGDIITTGKGEIVNDVLADPRKIDRNVLLKSLICVPLTAKDKVIGAIEIGSYELVNYTAEHLKLLTLVAAQAASAIEIAILHRKQLQESRREALLFQLSKQIHHSLDLETILSTTVEQVRNLLQIDRCLFIWYRPELLCINSCCPINLMFWDNEPAWEVVSEAKVPLLHSLMGYCRDKEVGILTEKLLKKEIICCKEIRTLKNPSIKRLLKFAGLRSFIALPIQTRSGQIGVLSCGHSQTARVWSDDEIELLQAVAEQLAIALNQAELYSEASTTAFIAQTQAEQLQQTLQTLQQTQAKLIHSEKMSSLGQLVAGVAHEINNPVNFIGGNLSHADTYTQDLIRLLEAYQQNYPQPVEEVKNLIEEVELDFLLADLPKLLHSMKFGVERIRQIVLSLRNFSRLDEAEIKPVDIHEGIDGTLMILEHRLKTTSERSAIKIVKDYGNLPLVECYAGQLNQVFMNILANAIDALEIHSENDAKDRLQVVPTIHIRTEMNEKNSVVIRIHDNGLGMTEQIKNKLFDPFFTTKPVGKGTGLGLSISYSIVVEKHGGLLKCFSQPGEGTEFWVEIPVTPEFSGLLNQGAKTIN